MLGLQPMTSRMTAEDPMAVVQRAARGMQQQQGEAGRGRMQAPRQGRGDLTRLIPRERWPARPDITAAALSQRKCGRSCTRGWRKRGSCTWFR